MNISSASTAAAATAAGIRRNRWEDVAKFNAAAPENAREMLEWATNRPAKAAHGALAQRGDLFLFGGTGMCGNRWERGSWYPIAAVWRIPRRGKGREGRPKLIAVKMDWY
jgi:hypothetical protein